MNARRIVWAVRGFGCDCSRPYLEDTCAGGQWHSLAAQSVTYGSIDEALEALAAADIDGCYTNSHELELVPVVEVQR